MTRADYGVLRAPTEILFGAGQRRALGRVAARYGRKVLVCTDARFAATPEMADLVSILEAEGLTFAVFDATEAELPRAGIEDCVAAYRDFAPDAIVGLGGGSCLDMAKLVALMLTHGGALPDYYGEFKVPGPTMPVIAIPTTAGTGSEATPVAVLGDADRAIKVGISSPHLIPTAAICDPELTLTCPRGLTAVSGADALAHAIECISAIRREGTADLALDRVFVGKNAFGDHLALSAIRLLFDNLARAVARGDDLEARSAVMLGATMAGLAFGSGGCSAAHALQYPVGARTHTAHGLGVGILLPYAIDYNMAAAADAYADIARTIGAAEAGQDDAGAAAAFAAALRGLFRDIGIPDTLGEIGVEEGDLDGMADLAMSAARLVENNPRPLDPASLRAILAAALAGPAT